MDLVSSFADLRRQIARMERPAFRRRASVPLGPAIDVHLPGGGLALGTLHEAAGGGADSEDGAAAALFVAGVLARTQGPVIWALIRPDLFAPALEAVGLHPDRVIYAEAGKPERVLMLMEEALREPGLGGVVGEIEGRFGLTASRRLQLAAEASGTIGFALRRSRRHDDPDFDAPSAALTRWRITTLPSFPPLPHVPDVPGLGRARWRLELRRARGAASRAWIVEACDAQGRLGFPADLEHGPDQARQRHAAG
jgi:protein ImuA